MNLVKTLGMFALAVAVGASGMAETLERREGFKIGERLTLRPYVTLSATYDSNVSSSGGKGYRNTDRRDFYWSISPSLWLHYNAETWSVILSGFYRYNEYFSSNNRGYNSHNFGEDLRFNWANSTGTEKGWSLILGQSFMQISKTYDMVLDDGSNYGGDSRQFQLAGSVQRRFNQYLHGNINASYYWLDYDNSGSAADDRYSFYGWDRWHVGMEVGFAPSQWTDIILSGSYQGYSQENSKRVGGLSDTSTGYTLQAGLGSYMTDRISYRLMGGISQFDYGKSGSANGFVYSASGNWKIGETWNTMLLASAYYQPSERQASSKSRVDAVSWGIAKVMVRGKLRATFDIRYRHETHEYELDADRDYDYNLDIWTGRLGLSYSFCRYLWIYAHGEYQKSMNDHASSRGDAYDYDRFRLTAGLRLSY